LKRVLLIATGWLFILIGIAGLFLPVLQGILFIVAGLLILSREYTWARNLVARLEARFPQASRKATRMVRRIRARIRMASRPRRSSGVGT
jgi:uncharacterized protein